MGLTIMEKLLGLVMIAIGAITFYVTYTNLTSSPNPVFFLVAALILAVLGIFLILAKAEEKE
jgi:hypothetical protein